MIDDELDDSLTVVDLAIECLKRWQFYTWPEVQRAAKSVGTLILEQLVSRDLWDGLTQADQAAVHWLMAEGHAVSGVQEERLDRDREGPRIQSLYEAADHFTALCGGRWYQGKQGRVREGRSAVDFAARFTVMPDGWREEAMRRAMAGQDIASTIAQAAMYRNILRSVHGIGSTNE
ncbi:hypothetical protein [Streptomyces sp. NBC_00878]|uniref:hypothetical protein n=1 Tax=Streptomyces sp. NBC_00878 TaxID=2975854 RepID=UPI002252C107|nr:hypothetical protein [Streptomyces sp. NBC_00878]MCX4910992.1 hypothetical protein [Streptomyces sp. NBC_00878]